MSFVCPEKSPCLQCDYLDMDKNSESCQQCKARFAYVSRIDPEGIVSNRSTTRCGGFGNNIQTKEKTYRKYKKIHAEVRRFAENYCTKHGADMEAVCDTAVKHPTVVRTRYRLVYKIHRIFQIPNTQIGKALGIHQATVGQIVRRQVAELN